MKTKIFFIDIAYYTPIFELISAELRNKEIYSYLVTWGEQQSESIKTITLKKNKNQEIIKKGEKIISDLEKNYPEYRLHLSINRDRFLQKKDIKKTEEMIFMWTFLFSQELDVHSPKLVIGEISTAIEYTFYWLAKSKGINYRHILNLPTESPKVTLFDHSHSKNSIEHLRKAINKSSTASIPSYKELCLRVRLFKPSYLSYIKNFKEIYQKNDYRKSIFHKKIAIKKINYTLFYNLIEKYLSEFTFSRKGKSILMLFHVQPESTPDFVSIYHSDQIELAIKIAESIPRNSTLYVKEHPNTISIRNICSFIKLLRMKNVRLIKRNSNTKELIKNSSCIVTIAGSAAYEAAEYGVPAIIFSDIFYQELNNTIDGRKYKNFSEAIKYAEELSTKIRPENKSNLEKWLSTFGLPGMIHDPRIAPEVLYRDNIICLSNLIVKYIE